MRIFYSKKHLIDGERTLFVDENSFQYVTCVKGSGYIENMEIKQGDSFFVPANYGSYIVKGKIELILT